MVKKAGAIVCKHCKKQINNKAKLVGLTFVCPYCEKPSEEVTQKKINNNKGGNKMVKSSRGGRMTAAKGRAAKSAGGRRMVKNRPAGKNIMRT